MNVSSHSATQVLEIINQYNAGKIDFEKYKNLMDGF